MIESLIKRLYLISIQPQFQSLRPVRIIPRSEIKSGGNVPNDARADIVFLNPTPEDDSKG